MSARLALLLCASTLSCAVAAQQSASSSAPPPGQAAPVRDAVRQATTSVVGFGKQVADGLEAGAKAFDTPRRGADGALLLTDQTSLRRYLGLRLLDVQPSGAGRVSVELGLRNDGDTPVRLVGLRGANVVLAADQQGYVYPQDDLANASDQLTVPEHAAIKQSFVFAVKPAELAAVRIYGLEIKR